MVSLVTFILVIGILIIVHEFGHFMTAKMIGVRVEKFYVGFGPQLWKKKRGDTEYGLAAIPLGGYVKLAGDNPEEAKGEPYEYFSRKPGERALIVFCGPLLNYILGFLCLWLVFSSGYPMLTAKVGGLLAGMGAEQAGVRPGDRIIAIDGEDIKYWDQMQQVIRSKKKASCVKIELLRDGKKYGFDVRLQQKELRDISGQRHMVGLLGITPEGEAVNVRHGPLEAFSLGLKRTCDITVITCRGLWQIIAGRLSLRDSVTGPLGIFYITGKAAEAGISAVIQLVAVLSISLAIFNLLPLPVLDGGHVFFLALERIRGKRLSARADNIITRAGLFFIISLAVVVTYLDVWRLFSDKIAALFK
jgi:regulator of sigma E protease